MRKKIAKGFKNKIYNYLLFVSVRSKNSARSTKLGSDAKVKAANII
jgi:hypothetical protein